MSKIINNPFLLGIKGMFGNAMVIRNTRGKQQLVNRPTKDRTKFSKKQEAVKAKFLRASQYAKFHADLAEAGKPTEYTSGINEKKHSVYLVAMSDYLKAPEVNYIEVADYHGAVGETIVVSATDDFKVTGVTVVITDGNGTQLETGNAIQEDLQHPHIWTYKTTVVNNVVNGTVIRATASDKARNKTSLEKVI